jgi:hypothetical protein
VALTFLKKLSAVIPTGSMRYQLHSHLTGAQPARSLSKVHASALTKAEGLCPRYYALHDAGQTKPADEWLTASEVVTYDIGHDIQDRLVHAFADMGKCIGDWECLACEKNHTFQARPKQCECGCKKFKPIECRFQSSLNAADCGIDMLRIVAPGLLRVTEIKTMDKDQFKGLVAPLAEHKLRTNLYLRIIAESGFNTNVNGWKIDTEKGDILYTTKGGFGCLDPDLKAWNLSDQFSPFKEYVVHRNDEKTEHLVLRAAVIKAFRAKQVPMPHGICSTANVKRAQFCDRKALCFSGKHPPQYEWNDA